MRFTEFGFWLLQGPPPPVHAEAGRFSTGVCKVVDAVWAPLHPVPKVAPPQVYASAPAATEGPPPERNRG